MAMSDLGRGFVGSFSDVHLDCYLIRWGYKVGVRWFCIYTIVEGGNL